MRILVGKTFGIGNAVMSVPMLKALATIGSVDVLIGSSPDDFGSFEVFLSLHNDGVINRIFRDRADHDYDIAVMAIPFDGRWRNGEHFTASRVLDGRPRPEFSQELGFSSWKKHEVEYQIENAIELGFSDKIPSMSFMRRPDHDEDSVYLGLGFKRDQQIFWSKKHWGNSRYVAFIRECLRLRPQIKFKTTGSSTDIVQTIIPISREVGIDLWRHSTSSLSSSFSVVGSCKAFFGNDTGMMHVAASMEMPTYGLMAFENVATKNRPWCDQWRVHDFSNGVSDPESVAADFIRFVWGSK